MRLEIRLLGTFEVKLDGQVVTGFKSDRVRALLAYLAGEAGRSHPRDRLAGLLWPDWPQKSAMSNLRYALSDLRKVIGDREAELPFLNITRRSLQFNLESNCWIDVIEFEHSTASPSLRSVDAGERQAAEERHNGEFLSDFNLADSPDFEAWVLAKRQYYQDKAVRYLQGLGEICEAEGEYEQAINYARCILQIEPWHERAHQMVMRSLAQTGERVEALSQYESLRRALEFELGVEPSPETASLYEQIRTGEIGAGEKSPGLVKPMGEPKQSSHNLPRQITQLIGRERQKAHIKELLSAKPLVSIVGPGGIGKTRLALQVGLDIVDQYPDGVWLCDLAPLSDPDLVVSTVARAMSLYFDAGPESLQKLVDYLETRQVLLLLDNCEHLLEASARLVVGLLQKCPQLSGPSLAKAWQEGAAMTMAEALLVAETPVFDPGT